MKQTFVFVHGAAMDGRMWRRHLAAIDSPGVAVTLSHFGKSPDTSRPLSLATHANDVVSAAAQCDGSVVLVGWSFGCIPVLEAALRLRTKVQAVTIYEPGAPELGRWQTRLRRSGASSPGTTTRGGQYSDRGTCSSRR